mmetsp:Transcript_33176/g.45957  ORF Transcript_33176/g.45957 Transcript_33176/m.45957 type:complete len:338 (+) Transcript_33176:197-1210(+)|eukprot:CAMPEP_0196583530 /NCGR_PEP_ID=MMETSP1081-20130531/43888_1 /TAXON_ID=36882 /ORGANISM="Pyramimonas amylifera, Strain CCMP720" /LENGTH=337 /DNA_ID=CAMNT_0041904451 /DNA_START=190 /DNA_END=1203 /DNA_ORIENTATION=-
MSDNAKERKRKTLVQAEEQSAVTRSTRSQAHYQSPAPSQLKKKARESGRSSGSGEAGTSGVRRPTLGVQRAPLPAAHTARQEEHHQDTDPDPLAGGHYLAAARVYLDHPVATSVSPQERDKLVSGVMRHMLFRQSSGGWGPVPREDLNKLVSLSHGQRRHLAGYVIALAQAKFPPLFGMEMRELERLRPAVQDPKKKAQGSVAVAMKVFVLRSLLPYRLRAKFLQGEPEQARHGFAMTVLALMLANDSKGALLEETLWDQLAGAGVERGRRHPLLGDPEAALQGLVRQRYIQKDKVTTPEGEKIQIQIAENALDEIPKESLIRFISDTVAGDEDETN